MSYEPYANAVVAAPITLRSNDFQADALLPLPCYAPRVGGSDQSPQLSWSAVPDGTRSVAVTAFDADAPIPGGFWHWVVTDIPATVTELAAGAGSIDGPRAIGAVQLRNDLGVAAYSGVNPPAGTGSHRLFVCVTALSVERLELPADASPALANAAMFPVTLGRGLLIGISTPGGPAGPSVGIASA